MRQKQRHIFVGLGKLDPQKRAAITAQSFRQLFGVYPMGSVPKIVVFYIWYAVIASVVVAALVGYIPQSNEPMQPHGAINHEL